MLRTAALVLTALGLAAPFAIAQQPSADAAAAQIQHDADLHARALAIVQAEQARAKQPLCPHANNTVDINVCNQNEFNTTDGNEIKLVRALGALLRSGGETPDAPLGFDKAEATWHLYRDQACTADGAQYAGGSMRPMVELGCKLAITRHHIEELWAVYNDLGTH